MNAMGNASQSETKINNLSHYSSHKMKLPANTFRMFNHSSCALMYMFLSFSLFFAFGFIKLLKNSSDSKWNGKYSEKKKIRNDDKNKIGKWQVACIERRERENWQSSTAINPWHFQIIHDIKCGFIKFYCMHASNKSCELITYNLQIILYQSDVWNK